ncbi:SufE family protein [Fulvimarina sp. 2208YS6-2-32]|uniref:SufE family protein n=1 Tax=Fulvimarina uroteuthidis TaxID=3098149 RepID=A0ABU5I3M3_9HYPH|nr:SufE family protein [Fulvimarina sp. 2208YS6-2-32]MDY8109981.1 SufE family protein [Fulvimarina sp. 2208YS6-2-32]
MRTIQRRRCRLQSIEDILSDFEFLDDWEDRYRYLIDLGRTLPPLEAAEMNDATRVQGCVSQVWLVSETDGSTPPRLTFRGASDAHIVKGLVAIALALFSHKTAPEILKTDALATFKEIGLEEHLTPQRANGLRAMVDRIKRDADAAIEKA